MTAFNVVRFRVKPGREAEFVEAHRKVDALWPGLLRFSLVSCGERRFFIIGEWEDMEALAGARPNMIAVLDTLRPLLEELGEGLGVTDPISGISVLELRPGG